MFGAFRPTSFVNGSLLWKVPYRLSSTRKANLRKRLRRVDDVIAAVAESGVQTRSLERAQALPTEAEMKPKDKYTVFDPKYRGWRKGIHKVPKWTRVSRELLIQLLTVTDYDPREPQGFLISSSQHCIFYASLNIDRQRGRSA